MVQEKKVLSKNVFLNDANFVKAAKFHRDSIFKSKDKKDISRFDQGTCRKLLSPIGCTEAEKWGGGVTDRYYLKCIHSLVFVCIVVFRLIFLDCDSSDFIFIFLSLYISLLFNRKILFQRLFLL